MSFRCEMKKMILPNDILLGEASDLLAKGVEVILMTKGNSMLPFIRGEKDSVKLRRMDKVSVCDVVLARIDGRRYVLHRVIAIDGDNVTLMGDGNLKCTESCTLSDIVGTAVGIVRPSGKCVKVNNGKIWRMLRPFRRYILAIYRRVFL